MLFHFTVLFFSVLFFVALLFLSERDIVPAWSFYITACGSLIVLSVIAARKLTDRWYTAYLPSTLAFSVPFLLSLIDRGFETRIFIIAASGLYYLALLGVYRLHQSPEDKTARAMLNLAALASLFFVFAATYGLYLNYEVPIALLLGVFFSASFIVAFQTLFAARGDKDARQVLVTAFVIGLLMTELMWIIHFWPFGYVTIGVVLTVLFFIFWNASVDFIRGEFSPRRFLGEGALLLALLSLLLLSVRWGLAG